MIRPQNIHALDHFKRNTAEFRKRMKQTNEPEVLTVDGRAELVVMSPEAYHAILVKLEELDTLKALLEGLRDVKAGRVRPAEEVFKDLFRKHGLSEDDQDIEKRKRA